MAKRFNDTGTCIPHKHYMVDTSKKIEKILSMVEDGKYFTINRPRQYGKTTTLFLLCKELEKRIDYLVIDISFEGIGDDIFKSEVSFCPGFFSVLSNRTRYSSPEMAQKIESYIDKISSLKTLSLAITYLFSPPGLSSHLRLSKRKGIQGGNHSFR